MKAFFKQNRMVISTVTVKHWANVLDPLSIRMLHPPDFAASRGYYAMFYVAEALLLDRGLSFSSHSAVIAAFGKESAKTGVLDARFHRCLPDAQDFRNLGDYGVGRAITAEQARQVLEWAAEFLQAAERYLSPIHDR